MASNAGDTVAPGDRELELFFDKIFAAASVQGRLAYLLMSIHATNPDLFHRYLDYEPYPLLLANMVYGMTMILYSRPNMILISPFNRVCFSILGSAMFSSSSIMVFKWLGEMWPERPILVTFLGYLSGRIMMIHLLAYLYHIDSRMVIPGIRVPRDPRYEVIYNY